MSSHLIGKWVGVLANFTQIEINFPVIFVLELIIFLNKTINLPIEPTLMVTYVSYEYPWGRGKKNRRRKKTKKVR